VNLSDLHRRLLSDVLAIGAVYPLGITGGYAVQAHGLVDRLSQDLDVATENPAPMEEITRTVNAGLTARGWEVRKIGMDPLSGRLVSRTLPAVSSVRSTSSRRPSGARPRHPSTAPSSPSTTSSGRRCEPSRTAEPSAT
jgi:hypothetical protein